MLVSRECQCHMPFPLRFFVQVSVSSSNSGVELSGGDKPMPLRWVASWNIMIEVAKKVTFFLSNRQLNPKKGHHFFQCFWKMNYNIKIKVAFLYNDFFSPTSSTIYMIYLCFFEMMLCLFLLGTTLSVNDGQAHTTSLEERWKVLPKMNLYFRIFWSLAKSDQIPLERGAFGAKTKNPRNLSHGQRTYPYKSVI